MPIILGGGSSSMSQPLKIVTGPAQREYIVIDNGAAGVTIAANGAPTTANSGWTGVTDGLNFDNAVNGANSSNGYTNPTANNQTVPDFVALQATITASIIGSGRVTYRNPS